jgi:hypothetical protein
MAVTSWRQANEYPFVVRTVPEGSTFAGFDTQEAADAAAAVANEAAQSLGAVCRYAVHENPDSIPA